MLTHDLSVLSPRIPGFVVLVGQMRRLPSLAINLFPGFRPRYRSSPLWLARMQAHLVRLAIFESSGTRNEPVERGPRLPLGRRMFSFRHL